MTEQSARAITIEKCFLSGLPDGVAPVGAYGYREEGLRKGPADLPWGFALVLKYGIVFLALTTGGQLRDPVHELLGEMVKGLELSGIKSEEGLFELRRLSEHLRNPATFEIPYWEISKIEFGKEAGPFFKRDYIRITAQRDGGELRYIIVPEAYRIERLQAAVGYLDASRLQQLAFNALFDWSIDCRISGINKDVYKKLKTRGFSDRDIAGKLNEAVVEELKAVGISYHTLILDFFKEHY